MGTPDKRHILDNVGKTFRKGVRKAKGALHLAVDPRQALEDRDAREDLKKQLGKGMTMTRQQVRPSPFGDPTRGVYQVKGKVSTTTIEVAGLDWHGIQPGKFRGEPSWDVAGAPLALIGTREVIEEWLSTNADGYLLNGTQRMSMKEQGVTAQDHMLSDEPAPDSYVVAHGTRFTPLSKKKRYTVINPITAATKLLATRVAGVAAGAAMTGNIATTAGDYLDAGLSAKDSVSDGDSGEVETDEILYSVELTATGPGAKLKCKRVNLGDADYYWYVRVSDAADDILAQLG